MHSVLSALVCLSLVIWSLAPSASHVPYIFEVVAEHTDMIADHGHSHGFEEDLFWALHGHSHDVITARPCLSPAPVRTQGWLGAIRSGCGRHGTDRSGSI